MKILSKLSEIYSEGSQSLAHTRILMLIFSLSPVYSQCTSFMGNISIRGPVWTRLYNMPVKCTW